MANVVEYVLKITGGKSKKNIRDLAKELDQTKKELKLIKNNATAGFDGIASSSKKAGQSILSLKKDFTLLTGVVTAAAASYFQFNKEVADSVNELVDASTRSGIATEKLAGLRLALEGSGKSFSEVERGLDQFKLKLVEVAKGTGDVSKIMGPGGLGISVKNLDGSLRDVDDVFTEVVEKLSLMEDATSRNIALQKLFGRSGSALAQSGAIEDLDKFIEQAKQLGPALDENGIEKAAKFQRGLAELKTSFVGFVQVVLEGITGEKGIGSQMSVLAVQLKDFGKGLVKFLQDIKKFVDGINKTIEPLKNSLGGLTGILSNVPGFAGLNTVVTVSKQASKATRTSVKNTSELEKQFKKLQTRQEKIVFLAEKFGNISNRRFIRSITSDPLSGISFKDVAKAVEKLEKSQEIKFDANLFAPSTKKTKKPSVDVEDDELKEFIELQKELASVTEKSTKEIDKQIKAIEKEEREVSKAQQQFQELKKQVDQIGEDERPFQNILNDLDETKNRFKELGQSVVPVIQLKMQVHELRKEVEKLATTKTAINITTDIIGIAGGDIIGGVTGILQKTLKGSALELLGPVSGAIGGLVSFGQGMQQAADQAIAKREEKLGRSLTEEERAKLSDIAMRKKAEQDVKQFAMAIEVGLRMLPQILFEVLPPLFIDLGASIIKALFELPFRIAKAIVQGVFNFGAKVAEAPLNIMKGLADFFGFDSKRSGGRMISARRGLRFTGSSDTMAQLHRNEYVVPESGARPQAVERIMNQQSGSGINITINADVVERDAIETLVRKIEQRFQNFGTMQSSLFAS